MSTQDSSNMDFEIDDLLNSYLADNPTVKGDASVKVDTKIAPQTNITSEPAPAQTNNPQSVENSTQNSTSLPEQIIILTIDDDKWIQRIFSQYLQQWGFKHILSSDAFSGLTEAINQQPHLIFLDLIMPDVTGEVLLQFLKNLEYTRDIPVVIISGNLNKEVLRNTYILGAKGFISKPFNQDILYSKIKEVIDPELFEKMVDLGRIVPNALKKKPQII
ncbi:MAG: response regulator [Candidatus Kapabacteria bacterium]|nr:response regulator [Candidatus Kapabacteria bacterium]